MWRNDGHLRYGSRCSRSANQKRNTSYRPACAFLFATRRVLANKVTSAQYFRYGSGASATESSFCGFELAVRRKRFASLVRPSCDGPSLMDKGSVVRSTDEYPLACIFALYIFIILKARKISVLLNFADLYLWQTRHSAVFIFLEYRKT